MLADGPSKLLTASCFQSATTLSTGSAIKILDRDSNITYDVSESSEQLNTARDAVEGRTVLRSSEY